MLQLSVREFNKNISKAMKNLPVEITNRGVPFATIISAVPQGKGYKRVVFSETVKANGTPMPAPAKFVNIKKEDIENGIEVDEEKAKKSARESVEAMMATNATTRGTSPKNAGGSSSVTPSHSATPPPPTEDFPMVHLKFRKKLCPTHSIFSCGCPEKEGKGEQR